MGKRMLADSAWPAQLEEHMFQYRALFALIWPKQRVCYGLLEVATQQSHAIAVHNWAGVPNIHLMFRVVIKAS